MTLIQRAQDILLRPKQTWPIIDVEPATTASIYSGYLVFLAAIPAVAAFIGLSIIGAGAFGFGFRIPIVAGLVQMVVSYVMALVGVFVMALIVDALAPTFNGTKSQIGSLKLVAYAMTAAFVGGIFSLLPSLSILGLLAGIYSIYLLFVGIPVLMKCPPEKAGAYTAVVVVCAIVAGLVFGALSALLVPRHLGAFGAGGVMSMKTPDGDVTIDTSKISAAAAQMDAARQNMEAAQKSGDTAATGKALGDMMGAITGGGGAPIDPQQLKAKLPDAVGDLKRDSIEASGGQAMGIGGSSAKAGYTSGDKHVELTITDIGGVAGMAALAGWANMTVDKETTDSIEKVYKDGARTIHEEYRKDGSHGEYTVMLQNNLIVEAEGDKVDIDTLKSLATGLDLGGLESMKRPAKS